MPPRKRRNSGRMLNALVHTKFFSFCSTAVSLVWTSYFKLFVLFLSTSMRGQLRAELPNEFFFSPAAMFRSSTHIKAKIFEFSQLYSIATEKCSIPTLLTIIWPLRAIPYEANKKSSTVVQDCGVVIFDWKCSKTYSRQACFIAQLGDKNKRQISSYFV